MRSAEISSQNLFLPSTDDDRRIVREELDRLLSSPLFRNSKRYPSFLRHVVEEALAGRSGLLKERSLAIDLFERSADYDTSSDHIVRSTATEIRKRIAQYYHDAGELSKVRIDLPAGAYIPEFRLVLHAEPAVPASVPAVAPEPSAGRGFLLRFRWFLPAAAIATAVAALLYFAFRPRPISGEEALAEFWQPMLHSSESVIFCTSWPWAPATPASSNEPPSYGVLHKSEEEHVSIGDVDAIARLASFLGSRNKTFRIQQMPVSLADLRQGPIILIGGLNNQWTKRLTGHLRFRFERDSVAPPGALSRKFWIRDSLQPDRRDWSFDFDKPTSDIVDDYALISRVWDPTIGKHLIAVAGLAKYGTVAASEFLTDPTRFAGFSQHAPAGWSKKNVQVVIRTKVIGDNSGSPEILAVNVW